MTNGLIQYITVEEVTNIQEVKYVQMHGYTAKAERSHEEYGLNLFSDSNIFPDIVVPSQRRN